MDLEPVVLNCRHTFCRGCLKDAYANQMTLCPICRQEISHRQWLSIVANDTATQLIPKPRRNTWQSQVNAGVSSGERWSSAETLWTGATGAGQTMSYGFTAVHRRGTMYRPSTGAPSSSAGMVSELGLRSASSVSNSFAASTRPLSSYDIRSSTTLVQRRGGIATRLLGSDESERSRGRRTGQLPPLQSPR
jgi:hypothetical protein